MTAAVAIAVAIWWTANTVAHLFIHRPFFRQRPANACCAAALTAVLGFPQSVWRDRHLAHHAGKPLPLRFSSEASLQAAIVAAIWTAMALEAPRFFVTAYLPGYAGGLLLCALHGHYEHAAGTTSHYGRLYNTLCFNDGYHVEHHLQPSRFWTELPACKAPTAHTSAWPAPLRWLDAVSLETLERIVLQSSLLQRIVLRLHERALAPLVAGLPAAARIAVVGGGLFPRTALILRRLVPQAAITIIDANRVNLELAAARLDDARTRFVHGRYPLLSSEFDFHAVVFPLAFDGDRDALYADPPAPVTIVHDWLWRKRGDSRVVSTFLLKRINLVEDARH